MLQKAANEVELSYPKPPRVHLSFHRLSHKAFGGLGIAAALRQYVENEPVLIDAAPKPVFLAAIDRRRTIKIPHRNKT